MKTIAIISSCDTKHQEAAFMKEQLIKDGVNAMIVDMSIGLGENEGAVEGADDGRHERHDSEAVPGETHRRRGGCRRCSEYDGCHDRHAGAAHWISQGHCIHGCLRSEALRSCCRRQRHYGYALHFRFHRAEHDDQNHSVQCLRLCGRYGALFRQ